MYRSILENTGTATVIIEENGRIEYANSDFAQLSGFSKKEIEGGKCWTDFISEDCRDMLADYRKNRSSDQSAVPNRYETIFVDKTGVPRHVLAGIAPIPDSRKVFVSLVDVTDQKWTQQLQKTVEDNLMVGVYVMREGQFVYVNSYLPEFLGCSAEELMNRDIRDFIHEEDRHDVRQHAIDMLAGRRTSPYEFRVIDAEGRLRWLMESLTPVHFEGKVAIMGNVIDITELKAAHEKIERLASLESSILSAISHALIGLQSRRIIFANKSFEKVFGWRPDEIVGQFARLIFHTDEEYEAFGSILYRALKDDATHLVEPPFPFRHKDGNDVFCQVMVARMKNGTDEEKYVATFADITSRKHTEDALKISEEKYRTILRNMEDGYYEIDLEGNIIYFNASTCKILGYSENELQGMNYRELMDRKNARDAYRVFRNVFVTKVPSTVFEWQFERKDGEQRYLEVSISLVQDAKGRATGFCGIMRDTTERKRREEALYESEERYRMLTENVVDGVALIRDGITLFANNTLVAMFGYERADELVGTPVVDLVHEGFKERFLALLEAFENGDHSKKVFRCVGVRADGSEFWIEGHNNIIRWRGRLAVLSTTRDITEVQRRELAEQENTERLKRENLSLKKSIKDRWRLGALVGKSASMQEVYELIYQAAMSDANVIVYGESGTGKELVARAIHDLSARHDNGFVPVNCGAIPESLLESELFGHTKGAFTGAYHDKRGYLDLAAGGSLFLDEIGELALAMQVKLLRAIEGGGYIALGSSKVITADARIIASTNRDLKHEVRRGAFREDLFYRIHIIPITLPPLRERRDDIPLLIEHFLELYGSGKKLTDIPAKIRDALYKYDWPGNVRELQNVLRRYLTIKHLDFMTFESRQHIAGRVIAVANNDVAESDLSAALGAFEKHLIIKTLEKNQWYKGKTASNLGISRRTLFRKMKYYGLL